MKASILFLSGLIFSVACFAQASIKEHSLTLISGPSYLMRQDLIYSPFVHKDFSLMNIGLMYSRETSWLHEVTVRFSNFNPMLTIPYEFKVQGERNMAMPHNFNFIDLDYILGKAIRETENSSLYLGGLITADIQPVNYVYGRISSFGYYSAFGLGVFGKYKLNINQNNTFAARFKLPLVTWVSRPPYLGIDDEFIENISSHSISKTFVSFLSDGDLLSLNKIQVLDFQTDYFFKVNENWNIGILYLLEAIHSLEPKPLLSFRNSINLALIFNFK